MTKYKNKLVESKIVKDAILLSKIPAHWHPQAVPAILLYVAWGYLRYQYDLGSSEFGWYEIELNNLGSFSFLLALSTVFSFSFLNGPSRSRLIGRAKEYRVQEMLTVFSSYPQVITALVLCVTCKPMRMNYTFTFKRKSISGMRIVKCLESWIIFIINPIHSHTTRKLEVLAKSKSSD